MAQPETGPTGANAAVWSLATLRGLSLALALHHPAGSPQAGIPERLASSDYQRELGAQHVFINRESFTMTEAMILQRLERQADRVRDHSAHVVNRRIVREIDANVERCHRDGRDAVIQRLTELDHEWDIDRVLMANFAVVGGSAYAVGLDRFAHRPFWGLGRRRKGWLYFLGAQLGFLFMHAAVGWCPPVVFWRRLGVRTKAEIEAERSLLLIALEPELKAVDGLAPLSAAPQVAS